jgi:hypothetical protein
MQAGWQPGLREVVGRLQAQPPLKEKPWDFRLVEF